MVRCKICGKEFTEKGIGSHMWRIHGNGKNFSPTKGRPAWNKGLTKETSESVRRQATTITRIRTALEIELDDDGKLRQRWYNKQMNARKEGLECFLTFDEYCQLVKDAGLVSSNLGFSGDKYVLARFNDQGDYTLDNCRFILQAENAKERDSHTSFTVVSCLEDGIQFSSVRSAANHYKINEQTIFDHIKSGRPIKSINKTFIRV